MSSTELRGSPAAGLMSHVDDVLALIGEWAAPRLLHPTTVHAARAPQFPELAGVLPGWGRQDPCPWGLGPELKGTKSPHWTGASASPATCGHFGGAGTLAWHDPVAGVACVALTDRAFGDWATAVWPAWSDEVRSTYSAS
jgi:hypothetical protein